MTAERLGEFLADFEDCFEVVRRKTLLSLQYYLSGLLSLTVRKNIDRIAEQDSDVNYQNIQRCISDLDWSVQPVIDRISARANETFSRSDDNALLTGGLAYFAAVAKRACGSWGDGRNHVQSSGLVS